MEMKNRSQIILGNWALLKRVQQDMPQYHKIEFQFNEIVKPDPFPICMRRQDFVSQPSFELLGVSGVSFNFLDIAIRLLQLDWAKHRPEVVVIVLIRLV
jgi:hypothetical protein